MTKDRCLVRCLVCLPQPSSLDYTTLGADRQARRHPPVAAHLTTAHPSTTPVFCTVLSCSSGHTERERQDYGAYRGNIVVCNIVSDLNNKEKRRLVYQSTLANKSPKREPASPFSSLLPNLCWPESLLGKEEFIFWRARPDYLTALLCGGVFGVRLNKNPKSRPKQLVGKHWSWVVAGKRSSKLEK